MKNYFKSPVFQRFLIITFESWFCVDFTKGD